MSASRRMAEFIKTKNVFVIGAQCTGKSTLVKALSEHFAQPNHRLPVPTIIREVARTVLKQYNFTREDITSSPTRALQLQRCIMQAQLEAERAATSGSLNSWFISDRSGIDPIVYAHVFVGAEAASDMFASATWTELERALKAGIVVLCEAGCSWLVDDGTRLMPKDIDDWMVIDNAFRALLGRRGIDYVVISNKLLDITERVTLVADALEGAVETV